MFKNYFLGIFKNRYILKSLAVTELQRKYRGSVLGIAWSIITPLGIVLIIGAVYAILFSQDPKIFIPTLFAGLTPWTFISGSADGGTIAFIIAEGYLKQTNVQGQIFPLKGVIVAFVTCLYGILAFFSIYLFLQPKLFSYKMLMLLPGLLLMLIFSVGLANFSSVINLKTRDFQPLQSLILQALFYATPVIYDSAMLKGKGFEIIYKINPFYYVLEVVKRPMLGYIPEIRVYVIATIISFLVFFGSIYYLMKNKTYITMKL